jgi:DNA-binding transcriptional MocR family regulator
MNVAMRGHGQDNRDLALPKPPGNRLPNCFTPEVEAQIGEEYFRGASARALAKKYKVTDNTIKNVYHRSTTAYREFGWSNRAQRQITEEIARAYRAGKSPQDITLRYGFSNPATVEHYLTLAENHRLIRHRIRGTQA